MYVPLEFARISWADGGPVFVSDIRRREFEDAEKGLPMSGGASYRYWQEADAIHRLLYMQQEILRMMLQYKCSPASIHKAFIVVPEYLAMLSSDHPDTLSDKELTAFGVELPESMQRMFRPDPVDLS